MQRGVESCFRSGVTRRSLIILRNPEPIFDVARRREENEVSDAVVKAIRFKTQSVGGVSHSEIDSVAEFTLQIRIADFKCEIARMRTEVVQLFHRGCSVRMSVVCDDSATSPRRNAYTHGTGKTCESSIRQYPAHF